MRFLKTGFYFLGILLLQTVVFPRLSFMGVIPDLVLVSVILFTVFLEATPALILTVTLSFLQDVLSAGIYYNTILKVLIFRIVANINQGILEKKYSFVAALVTIFVPISLAVEGVIQHFFLGQTFGFLYFFLKIAVATIYNLIVMPPLFYIVKVLIGED